jgi:diketogulonate reductase-like aldo/keto reductase
LQDAPLPEIAEKYGKTPAQVIIRWNLQYGVVPLMKAASRQHQQENIAVFDFELSNDDMARLDNMNVEFSSLTRTLSYI